MTDVTMIKTVVFSVWAFISFLLYPGNPIVKLVYRLLDRHYWIYTPNSSKFIENRLTRGFVCANCKLSVRSYNTPKNSLDQTGTRVVTISIWFDYMIHADTEWSHTSYVSRCSLAACQQVLEL